jgi:cullin 3
MSSSYGKQGSGRPRRDPFDGEQADKHWNKLQSAILEIYNHNASGLSFEELYRCCYNLVLHKHAPMLYGNVSNAMSSHLKKVASAIETVPDDQLLHKLNDEWEDHKITTGMVRDILMYLDRTYISQRKETPIYELGFSLFGEVVARDENIKGRLRDVLLSKIKMDRDGHLVDKILLKNTLIMLVELGVDSNRIYEQDFEEHFIRSTDNFYVQESQVSRQPNRSRLSPHLPLPSPLPARVDFPCHSNHAHLSRHHYHPIGLPTVLYVSRVHQKGRLAA